MRMHELFRNIVRNRNRGLARGQGGFGGKRPSAGAGWAMVEAMEPRAFLTVIGTPDVYSAAENTPLIVDGVGLSGVLANDTTGTVPGSRAVVASQPQHGALSLNNNGTFSYTPNPNFHGVDSFTYIAQGDPTPATLINATTHSWRWLHPTNGQNPATTDADFPTTWYLPEGNPLVPNFPGVGSGIMGYGAIDVGPITTPIGVNNTVTAPPSGSRYTAYFRTTFEFPGDPSTLTDMVLTGFFDDGAFIYLNGLPLTSLNMPVVAADTYTGLASNSNNTEIRGSLNLFAQIPNLASRLVQGTNTLAISLHNAAADSSDLGMQVAIDAIFADQSAPVTVTLNVQDSMSPPVGTPDTYVMAEGGSLQVQAAGGLLANDGELGIDQGTLLSIQPPADLPAGAVFTPNLSNGTFSLNLAGAPDFFGPITFSYILQDIHGQSDPVPVTVFVTNINDAPVAIDDPAPGEAYVMDQGTSFTSGDNTAQTQIFGKGSLWSYDDSGTDLHTQNPDWNDLGFNPSSPGNGSPAWKSGVGELGYGDDQATLLSFGPSATSVYPTYYFRKTFNLPSAADFNAGTFGIEYDDGAVLYINGREIFRENMPTGNIAHGTLAIAGSTEDVTVTRQFFIPAGVLVDGENVVAVEIHQTALNSSDTSFDMEMSLFKATGVIINDQDADSAGLTVQVATQPARGSLTFDAFGNFTYTPQANYFGPDSFTYTVTDALGQVSAPATVRFDIQEANVPPTPTNDTYSFPEGGTLNTNTLGVSLLTNDALERPITALQVVQQPTNGAIFLSQPGLDGHFVLTHPDPEFSGQIVFSYQLTDAVGTGPVATVTIDAFPVNDPPIAQDDPAVPGGFTTLQGEAFSSSAIFNLVPHGANWRFLNITTGIDPAIADADFNTTWFSGDGAYNGPDFSGPSPAPFHAGVVDGLSGGTTLIVPPSTLRYTSYYTTTFNFSGNPADIVQMTANLLVDDGMAIYLNGTLVGRYNFTAADTFMALAVGTESESFFVNPNLTNFATALVNGTNHLAVSVHQANNTSSDFGFDLRLQAFGTPGGGLLANDTDIDTPAANLRAILDEDPGHGSVTLDLDGQFIYTPNPNFIGVDSFSYFANDGSNNSLNPATVTINVVDGNLPPVVVNDINIFTNEDETLDTTLLNDFDGVYSNDGLLDFEGTAFDPILDVIVDASETRGVVQFNAATGHFLFMPEPEFSGLTSFTYEVIDKDGLSNIATVNITVNAVNDPPVAHDDFYEVLENGSLSQTASLQAFPRFSNWFYEDTGQDLHTMAPNWNSLGFDPQAPTAGPVWKSGVGKFGFGDASNTSLQDLDQPTFYFRKNITLTGEQASSFDTLLMNVLRDDGVVIYINGVEVLRSNLPTGPITYASLATAAVDGANETVYFPFIIDLDDPALFPSGSPLESGDNVIAVELHQAFLTSSDTGFDMDMTLAASDKGLLANDVDVDDALLTANLVTGPQFGSLSLAADGSFTYTPFGNYSGPDSFTYRISDGEDFSQPATVHINVIDSTGAPPVALDDFYSVYEDTSLVISDPAAGLLANEAGIANGLTIVYDEPADGPVHGTLTLNLNDGTFTYVPDEDFAGVDQFTYRVSDGMATSDPAIVTITVINATDIPIAIPDDHPLYAAQEGGAAFDSAAAGAPSLLANDLSPDGLAMTASLLSAEPGGSVVVNPDGSFIFTPSPNFHGDYHFQYNVHSSPIRLIERGGTAAAPVGQHVWSYLDNGTDPGPTWNTQGFNDSNWRAGVGEFGYGEGDERRVVDFVDAEPSTPGSVERNATTFFRTTFQALNAATIARLTLNALWDDGVAIYLNGQEIFRQFLAPDAAFNTYATGGPASEGIFLSTIVPITPGMLVEGDNLIAVEIHQVNNTSSDISFDLELDALYTSSAQATVHVAPADPIRPPVGIQDLYTGDEDAPVSGNVLDNEFGPGLTANLFLGMPESIGAVILNADGSFIFTPAPDFNSTHLPAEQFPGDPNAAAYFFYTVTRDFGGGVSLTSDPIPVRITINPLPDAPIGSPDTYFVEPGAPFTAVVTSSVVDLVRRGGTAFAPIGDQVWSYLDDGTDPGYFWNKPGFDDSAWDSGVGELGYGEGDERTIVGFVDVDPVTPGAQRNATTFFRTHFNIDDPNAIAQLAISVLADDGVAVYFNGREIFRNNLAPDASYTTYAPAAIGAEGIFLSGEILITPGLLRAGENLIAVEVHQESPVSSDMTMDLELRAVVIAQNEGVLANDADPDHQAITATLVTPPQFHDSQGGAAPFVLNPDGSFTYRRLAGVFGLDSFTYIATDGVNSSAPITVELFTLDTPGDLNGDHVLDAADIDALFAHIRDNQPYDPAFDLDESGVVDPLDVQRLITDPDLLNSFFGDANLNGAVSLGDLVILAAHYETPGGWANGDFSGDGVISMSDLIILAEHFGEPLPGDLTGGSDDDGRQGDPVGLEALGLIGLDDSEDEEKPQTMDETPADILAELGRELRN